MQPLEMLAFLLDFFGFLILGRVIISWLVVAQIMSPTNPIASVLVSITEPILGPIRNIIPRVGMFDFSPMLLMIFLFVASGILHSNA